MQILFPQMSVCDTVALEVVSGYIIVYDQRGEEMFCHNLRYLQKLAGGQIVRSLGMTSFAFQSSLATRLVSSTS